jgi:hypothetical protein
MDYSIIRIQDEHGMWRTLYEGANANARNREFVIEYAHAECRKHGWDFVEVNAVFGTFEFEPAQFLVHIDEKFEYIYDVEFDDYTPDHLLMF